jgi:uncharacterized Zn finger protein
MTRKANLSCFKVGCSGEFRYLGAENGDILYECRDCGADLRQEGVEELAGQNGPVGQLARALLEGR